MEQFVIREKHLKNFKTLCKAREQGILGLMANFLKTKYTNVRRTPTYVIAEGSIPVALVAHADTVFKTPPSLFFYDTRQSVIWSPDGMGADDRAGIFAIMEILRTSDLRPHVIITTGEEIGCVGASKLVGDYYKFPWDLKFLIQLDRRGKEDCVFYDCDNLKFQTFIETFGFKTDWGSMSDISVLAPAWEIAAVNLSVGYYEEHTKQEFLCFQYLFQTIERTKQILMYVIEHPEMEKWEYIPLQYNYASENYDYAWGDENSWVVCPECHQTNLDIDMVPMKFEKLGGKTQSICIDCFARISHLVNYCDVCGLPWVTKTPKPAHWVCPDCEVKKNND